MKVILDYHRMRLTANNEYGLWFDDKYPESVWIKNWAMLAKKYANDTTVIGVTLLQMIVLLGFPLVFTFDVFIWCSLTYSMRFITMLCFWMIRCGRWTTRSPSLITDEPQSSSCKKYFHLLCGSIRRNFTCFYFLRVIAAIRQVNKNAIVYLEGMWNETWWGGNLADVQKYPIFDKVHEGWGSFLFFNLVTPQLLFSVST